MDGLFVSPIDDNDPSLGKRNLSFWEYIQTRFEDHLKDLAESAGIGYKVELLRDIHDPKQLWHNLVEQGDFVEVPSLKVPAARAIFLFQDREFFNLLQEEQRFAIRKNQNYQVHMPHGWEDFDTVEIKKEDFDRVPASGDTLLLSLRVFSKHHRLP